MATLASDGSIASIQSLINGAATGDTVTIPPGNYTWAGTVNLNKAITLTAQGIVPNNPPSPPVVITHNNGANALIGVTVVPAGDTTIAGISFQPGTATGSYISTAASGSNPGILILHNCIGELPNFQLLKPFDWEIQGGLIYQCSFQSSTDSGSTGWGSGSACLPIKSPYSYYNVSTLGALDTTGRANLYVEDCTIYNLYNQAVDVDDAGRVNVRYCHIINSQLLTHGITGLYGGRQVDFNNNVFEFRKLTPNSAGLSYVALNRWMWWRAGTGRVWGNQVDAISSQDWGTKPCWNFTNEPLTRAATGNGSQCETPAMYPGTRWPGTGSNGTVHPTGIIVSPSDLDPIYIWSNSAGPNSNGTTSWGCIDYDAPLQNCFNGPTSAVFLLNRDLFFSAPSNNPSPPYTPYVYPHPLRTTGGSGGGGGNVQLGTVSNQMGRIIVASPRVVRSAIAKLK